MFIRDNMKFQISKLYIALFIRSFLLLSPVILLFYQENGLNYKHFFLFQGVFYITSITAELPIGYISDNYSKKYMLTASLGIFFVVVALLYFYSGLHAILTAVILMAISKVMVDNATSGYIYDYLTYNNANEKMTKYYGYTNFYLAFGTAAAAIIGSLLYIYYGSKFILKIEIILSIIAVLILASLPNIYTERKNNFKNRIAKFILSAKEICTNNSIKYHILYSGFLTSFSILFALSFQPLMQGALFPIVMFGAITFINHGIRALSGIISGKLQNKLDIHKLIVPLYLLYISAFIFMITILNNTNIILNTALLIMICLIIGVQLLFSILHVCRLHKYVTVENRGTLMSLNNGFSRSIAAIILISSKFLMDKFDMQDFYIASIIMFLLLCTHIMIKTYKVTDQC